MNLAVNLHDGSRGAGGVLVQAIRFDNFYGLPQGSEQAFYYPQQGWSFGGLQVAGAKSNTMSQGATASVTNDLRLKKVGGVRILALDAFVE